MAENLECDAVDAAFTAQANERPQGQVDKGPDRLLVNPLVFTQNKRILTMMLAPHIKIVVLNVLRESRCKDRLFGPKFRAAILQQIVENKNNRYEVSKRLMREVVEQIPGRPEIVYLFISEVLKHGGLSNLVSQRIEEICTNTYRPKVPRTMMNLVTSRSQADQQTILRTLKNQMEKTELHSSLQSLDAEKVLEEWILFQQRQHYQECDAEGDDVTLQKKLETLVTGGLYMNQVAVNMEMGQSLRQHLGEQLTSTLIQRMRQDLGVFKECVPKTTEGLCQLISTWLFDQQQKNVISTALDTHTCWQYVVKLIQTTIPASELPDFFQPGQSPAPDRLTKTMKQSMETRLQSYGQEWAQRHPSLTKEIMARSGFFVKELNDHNWREDKTQCYDCGVVLKDWQEKDDPDLEHIWWSGRMCQHMVTLHGHSLVHFICTLRKWDKTKPRSMMDAMSVYFRHI